MKLNKLKQPTKYAHSSLQQPEHQAQHEHESRQQNQLTQQKTKQISKQRKTIRKPHEPSAIRLAAINQTFNKIQQNTQKLYQQFNIDKILLDKFLHYDHKVKCQCDRNIKYYCLKCMTKNQHLQFPGIQLPVKIQVVHHQSEKINKSSIIPMALLSKQIVLQKFHTHQQPEQLLTHLQQNGTYVLFPHKNSKKMSQISTQEIKNIKIVVLLDCTWFQTDQLVSCLQRKGFTNFIRLQQYQSLYWRYNHHSDKALSSAQALAYFLRQYQEKLQKGNVKQYDNIMFLYFLNLRIIESSYKEQISTPSVLKSKKQKIKEIKNNEQQKDIHNDIEHEIEKDQQ